MDLKNKILTIGLLLAGTVGGIALGYSPRKTIEGTGTYRGCTVDATGEARIKINDKWYETTLERMDTLTVDKEYLFTIKKPRFLFEDRVTGIREVPPEPDPYHKPVLFY